MMYLHARARIGRNGVAADNTTKTVRASQDHPPRLAHVNCRVAHSTAQILDYIHSACKQRNLTTLVNEVRVLNDAPETFTGMILAPANVTTYSSFAGLLGALSSTGVPQHCEFDSLIVPWLLATPRLPSDRFIFFYAPAWFEPSVSCFVDTFQTRRRRTPEVVMPLGAGKGLVCTPHRSGLSSRPRQPCSDNNQNLGRRIEHRPRRLRE